MNIIITAGGTTEKIDDVRVISNNSTGRLAREVAYAFLEESTEALDKVYYLHGKYAVPIENDKVVNIPIGGASELLESLTELLTREDIHAVIHAMAVSDYTVDQVLACDETGERPVETGKKISSEIETMKIVLKKTPKVIGEIKKLNQDVLLVGFKLLSRVSKEELIGVAHQLLVKNQCDFVLANDLAEITEKGHRGYLVSPDKSYITMETKQQIGRTICRRVTERLKG